MLDGEFDAMKGAMTAVDEIIARSRSLADAHRFREAIDALTEVNRDRPDSALEKDPCACATTPSCRRRSSRSTASGR